MGFLLAGEGDGGILWATRLLKGRRARGKYGPGFMSEIKNQVVKGAGNLSRRRGIGSDLGGHTEEGNSLLAQVEKRWTKKVRRTEIAGK